MPVLTALPATAVPRPAPAGCRRLVEQAVVNDALSAEGPETLVRTDIPQSDGSVRLYAAWTDGGGPLADHTDRVALARGLDAWSWIETLQRHARTTHRGRIEVRAYRLRQVLADVEEGYRGTRSYGRTSRGWWPPVPAPGIPAWVGVGPLLWHRYQGGDPLVERHWLAH